MNELLAHLDTADLLARFGIVFLRMSGLVAFLPVFGSQLVPVRGRIALAIVMTAVVMPIATPVLVLPVGLWGWALVAAREIFIGVCIGLAARMVFAGIETAAGLVAGQSGFAIANMVDPLSGDQGLTPAIYINVLATALFLAADMHHLLLHAIHQTYELFPAGASIVGWSSLEGFAGLLGARLLGIAIQLAAPALLVTFSMDLLLALVGRAMVQIPILIVGYPIKLAAGLIALAMLAYATGSAMGSLGRTIAQDSAAIVSALAGGR